MAKSANMFGFFLDELHKSGGGSPSSSSALSSADFSAALDFALQPKAPQGVAGDVPAPTAKAESSAQPDVVGTILREVAKEEPATSTVVSLANASGLGIDTLLAGLQRAVEHQLLAIVSAPGEPARYSRTEFAKNLNF